MALKRRRNRLYTSDRKEAMNCIFCGQQSTYSKSVEHIIPNSFGNNTAILRKGIVCDKCNNYFARKVEQPFLESDAVRRLRQELEIENRNGKVIKEYPYPRVGQEYVKQISSDCYLIYAQEEMTQETIAKKVAEYQEYMAETDKALLKEDFYVSRLLAKMAIEYFIFRCGSTDEVCEYVGTDPVFEDIRNYARYGSRKTWIYSARRICARNEAYQGDPFSAVNCEADYLFLGNGEVYFIIIMFGMEYAICLNHSETEGYKDFLKKNNGESPLRLPNVKLAASFDEYTKTMYTKSEMNELKQLIVTKGERR